MSLPFSGYPVFDAATAQLLRRDAKKKPFGVLAADAGWVIPELTGDWSSTDSTDANFVPLEAPTTPQQAVAQALRGGGASPAPASQAPTGSIEGEDPMTAYLASMGGSVGDLGELSDEADEVAQDYAEAQKDLDTPMPEGRNSGRVFTAANPLEFLGAGLRIYGGRKAAKKAREERKRIRTERSQRLDEWGDALSRALRGKRPKEAWEEEAGQWK